MKISISIGDQGKSAFERIIEDGTVAGITLQGSTLTFDYTGLSDDDALDRAVTNQRTVRDTAIDLYNAGDAEGNLAYNYASGFLVTAVANLANEQALKTPMPVETAVVDATLPEIKEEAPVAVQNEPLEETTPAPSRRRSKFADTDTDSE